jgi:hypothetical protein
MRTMPPDLEVNINLSSSIFMHLEESSRRVVIEDLKEDIISDLVAVGRGVVFNEVNNPKDSQPVFVAGEKDRERKYLAWARTSAHSAKARSYELDEMLVEVESRMERLRAEGWTKTDFARALKSEINEPKSK